MINEKFNNTTKQIIKIAAFVGAVTVIVSGYSFYINNFWKPKVQVLSVDFNKGIAEVRVGNKNIFIYGDAVFEVSVGGEWGIKFGSTRKGNEMIYDSLQLVKKGMVVEYLKR